MSIILYHIKPASLTLHINYIIIDAPAAMSTRRDSPSQNDESKRFFCPLKY